MNVVTEGYEQQTVRKEINLPGHTSVPDDTSAHEWFETFSGFWIAGILPIVLAWFAWRTVRLKVQHHNEERKKKYESLNKEQDYKEDTVMQYFKKRWEE